MTSSYVILVFIYVLIEQFSLLSSLLNRSGQTTSYIYNSNITINFTDDNSSDNSSTELSGNHKSYKSLNANDTLFLFIDHQTGLFNGVRTQTPSDFINNVIALAKTAKLFDIPTILTSSSETGPNGPILPELLKTLSNSKIIRRPGEINSWDNDEFRNTVKSYDRKKLVMAGISTDVCLTFAALSAIKEGYEVYAVIDASGTWSKLIEDTAIIRMAMANAHIMSWFAVSAELQKDWRRPTGVGLANLYSNYLPFYGNLIASRNATNSTGS